MNLEMVYASIFIDNEYFYFNLIYLFNNFLLTFNNNEYYSL